MYTISAEGTLSFLFLPFLWGQVLKETMVLKFFNLGFDSFLGLCRDPKKQLPSKRTVKPKEKKNNRHLAYNQSYFHDIAFQ